MNHGDTETRRKTRRGETAGWRSFSSFSLLPSSVSPCLGDSPSSLQSQLPLSPPCLLPHNVRVAVRRRGSPPARQELAE
jgi:hypothetical protein